MPPSPDGGESPGDHSSSLSPAAFKFCIILATMALVCAAAGLYFMYYTEKRTHGNLGHTMRQIRTHLTKYEETYKEMTDQQLLEEAKRLSDDLANSNGLSIVLEHKINFCRKIIKEGWVPFKGHLYFFTLAMGFHSDAQKDCEKRNAILAYITSAEVEDFLEEMVYRRGSPHWFGLQRISTQWVWEHGEPAEPPLLFWNTGKPGSNSDEYKICGEIIECAPAARKKCWQDAYCNTLKHWICMMPPDPIYDM